MIELCFAKPVKRQTNSLDLQDKIDLQNSAALSFFASFQHISE